MVTFKDMLKDRAEMSNELAVYADITRYLEQYVGDSDEAVPPRIDSDAGDMVPPEKVQAVIDSLQETYVKPLQKQISDLEEREIPDAEEEKEPKTSSSEKGAESQERSGDAGKKDRKKNADRSGNGASPRKSKQVRLRG